MRGWHAALMTSSVSEAGAVTAAAAIWGYYPLVGALHDWKQKKIITYLHKEAL